MMALVRRWLLGIVLTSFAVGMAQQIVPKGREQARIRLIGGVLLTLSLLRPLGDVFLETPSVSVGSWSQMFETQTESYREEHQKELAAIIAEKLETYIWDKAIESGMDGDVSVYVSVSMAGVPLPDTVTIGAPFDPALSIWLEEVVGIPAEKQIWQEGNTWTTERESAY